MKRFKVEKSRSTLWREARNVNTSMPENDADDFADDFAQFDEADDVSFPILSHVVEVEQCEQSDTDVISENEGCVFDKNVTAGTLECERSLENSLRWLNDDDGESESEDSLIEQLAVWSVEHNITTVATGELLSLLKPHLPFCQKILKLFAKRFAVHHI